MPHALFHPHFSSLLVLRSTHGPQQSSTAGCCFMGTQHHHPSNFLSSTSTVPHVLLPADTPQRTPSALRRRAMIPSGQCVLRWKQSIFPAITSIIYLHASTYTYAYATCYTRRAQLMLNIIPPLPRVSETVCLVSVSRLQHRLQSCHRSWPRRGQPFYSSAILSRKCHMVSDVPNQKEHQICGCSRRAGTPSQMARRLASVAGLPPFYFAFHLIGAYWNSR